MEQLDYNLLFRWFVGLNMDEAVWDPDLQQEPRALAEGDVAQKFFDLVLAQARERDLLSDEHFTVDGTLIEAWAGQKSFKRKEAADPSPPPMIPATPASISGGSGAPTPPMPRRRTRTPACTKRPGARGQAGLSGACAHGESARPGGGYPRDSGDGHGRAGGGAGDGGSDCRAASGHLGR